MVHNLWKQKNIGFIVKTLKPTILHVSSNINNLYDLSRYKACIGCNNLNNLFTFFTKSTLFQHIFAQIGLRNTT